MAAEVIIYVDECTKMTDEQWKYLKSKFGGRTMQNKLQEMFKMQLELQKFLDEDFLSPSAVINVVNIKEYCLHLGIETGEMLNELPYLKHWKNYNNMTAVELQEAFNKAKEEYIDMFHFLMNIGLLLGFDGDTVYEAYIAKNKENYDRQINKWNEGTHYTYKE